MTARPDDTGIRAAAVDIAVTTFGGHTVSALSVRDGELDVLTWLAVQTVTGMSSHTVAWPGRWRVAISGRTRQARHGGAAGSSIRAAITTPPMLGTERSSRCSRPFVALRNRRCIRSPTCGVFAQVIVRPAPALTTRIDVHAIALASAADGWYGGSGATQEEGRIFGYTLRPSGGQRRVTNVFEGSIEWRITARWTAAAYVAAATAGPVVPTSFRDSPAAFFYFENQVSVF